MPPPRLLNSEEPSRIENMLIPLLIWGQLPILPCVVISVPTGQREHIVMAGAGVVDQVDNHLSVHLEPVMPGDRMRISSFSPTMSLLMLLLPLLPPPEHLPQLLPHLPNQWDFHQIVLNLGLQPLPPGCL